MDPVARIPLSVETRALGGKTNAYIVGEEGGILIDSAARSPELDRAVENRSVTDVLVTHTHPDHVDGVSDYVSRTGATVWTHAKYRERFVRATGTKPDRTFEDGTRIESGNQVLTVLETPGHAPDHVACTVAGDIIVGDLAVATGSVAVTAGEGNLNDYLDSLRRLRESSPERLLPAHGPVIDEPEETLTRLIDHRLEREQRVREAVVTGARDLETITDAAYEKGLSAVRDLAEGTVAAHLEKLADEGDLAWDGERVEPV